MLDGLDQALQEASAVGVTVCAAAGDNGSADMPQDQWDGRPHADFPASDPFALACGGTTLQSTGSANTETVWNGGPQDGATGGGVSNFFPRPSYQTKINVPAPANKAGGRGLPDVAGNADPRGGYNVILGGSQHAIGGTSAVAPLWAGLITLINESRANQNLTPVGFVNAELYNLTSSSNAFTDITTGTTISTTILMVNTRPVLGGIRVRVLAHRTARSSWPPSLGETLACAFPSPFAVTITTTSERFWELTNPHSKWTSGCQPYP